MKKIILSASLCLSASAFAQICEVDMVDMRTNRFITRIRSYDNNDGCKEGMKECRKEIRLRGLLNIADCKRVTDTIPAPDYPTPDYPTPYGRCTGSVDDLDSVTYTQNDYYAERGYGFAAYNVRPATSQCKVAVLEEHRRSFYLDRRESPARFFDVYLGGNPQPQPMACRGSVDDERSVRSVGRHDYYANGSGFASYNVEPATAQCKVAILEQYLKDFYLDTEASPSRNIEVYPGQQPPRMVTCTGSVDDKSSVNSSRHDSYSEPGYGFAAFNVRPEFSACKKAILDEHKAYYWADRRESPGRNLTVTIEL